MKFLQQTSRFVVYVVYLQVRQFAYLQDPRVWRVRRWSREPATRTFWWHAPAGAARSPCRAERSGYQYSDNTVTWDNSDNVLTITGSWSVRLPILWVTWDNSDNVLTITGSWSVRLPILWVTWDNSDNVLTITGSWSVRLPILWVTWDNSDNVLTITGSWSVRLPILWVTWDNSDNVLTITGSWSVRLPILWVTLNNSDNVPYNYNRVMISQVTNTLSDLR